MVLYFVRHGETLGNVGGLLDYSMSGKLTPKGVQQAEALVRRLDGVRIDEVIVSPLERTVMTALPYLKKTKMVAQGWPELAEIGGNKNVPQELPKQMRYGPALELPEAARDYVKLDTSAPACLPPDRELYVEGMRRCELAANRIIERYAGKDITVLMVGHGCQGVRVLEALLRIEMLGRFQHDNVGMTLMRQKPNGEFIVLYMNRLPDPANGASSSGPLPPECCGVTGSNSRAAG
ncbi:MAG: hypothetical protein C0404_08215 [Verrucomicrobia bacterium]|nr:hypothetical protein [Verrucomicrobiota bacterium]